MNFVLISFYSFVKLDNYYDMKDPILDKCASLDIKGTILLAEEGINGSLCSHGDNLNIFFDFLKSDERLNNLNSNINYSDVIPFSKLKVNLRNEIVRFENDVLHPCSSSGYVEPNDWDDLIKSDDVVLIDTRNKYEIEFGSFEGALNPRTDTFREFANWADAYAKQNRCNNKRIAMCCTGGIRCEKSAAYMEKIGFKEVYQLKGGILNYLQKTEASLWHGDCFVFDDRVAIGKNLNQVEFLPCYYCSSKVDKALFNSVTKGKVICDSCKALV